MEVLEEESSTSCCWDLKLIPSELLVLIEVRRLQEADSRRRRLILVVATALMHNVKMEEDPSLARGRRSISRDHGEEPALLAKLWPRRPDES